MPSHILIIHNVQDGTSKMSKSAENDASRVNLTDDATTIANKIKRCKTDSLDGLVFDDPDRPESNNLLSIYQLCTGRTKVGRKRETSLCQRGCGHAINYGLCLRDDGANNGSLGWWVGRCLSLLWYPLLLW